MLLASIAYTTPATLETNFIANFEGRPPVKGRAGTRTRGQKGVAGEIKWGHYVHRIKVNGLMHSFPLL